MEDFKIKIEDKNASEYIAPRAFEFIKEILDNPIELGRGRAGKVFTREGESFCIKQIIDKNILFSSNSIEGEMDIQAKAIKNGARSPKNIMTLETESETFLVMEKIEGGSLKDIEEGVKELPKEFNFKYFWNNLENQIKKLHDCGIHHRDLHFGNIMFEIKKIKDNKGETVVSSVEPVIIDYGLSTISYGDDDNPYFEKNFPRTGETTKFKTDLGALKGMKEEFEKILTK